ncbi:MAG: hypothetical protein E4G92_01750 [Bacteroidia bacterium]|nr:MAG: hypothetical protein E4G92_01750 [Bacteroidia bacterium]
MKKSVSLFFIVSLVTVMVMVQGCKKPTLPIIVTTEVSAVDLNTATSGGDITSDGGEDIIARGVCWNTTGDPTINDSKSSDGKGTGAFISTMTGLQKGSVYYVSAYATNSVGTSYGEQFMFSTLINDVEGNKYKTVAIGSQLWMAENLKATLYNDNTQIPNVTLNAAWTTLTTDAYCWAQNDEATYKSLYGAIYNWYAVETGKLCPAGWHVPSDADFAAMEINLGLTPIQAAAVEWRGTDQGKQLKSTTGWNIGENGTNTSGFTALPAGYRAYATGISEGLGLITYWWTAIEQDAAMALYRRLDGNNEGVYRAATYKRAGKSVRCVKN